MKEITYRSEGTGMPEQPEFYFESNGSQGGDAGHGGYALLNIKLDSSSFSVTSQSGGYYDRQLETVEDANEATLIFRGDWELEGFALELIKLGLFLANQKGIRDVFNWENLDAEVEQARAGNESQIQ